MEQQEQLPLIEDWRMVQGQRIVGRIFNDNRFPDDYTIITSPVKSLDRTNSQAVTLNTRYRLGKEFTDESQ